MSNPLWSVGMKSANALGRPKGSSKSPVYVLDGVLKGYFTKRKVRQLLMQLSAKDQLWYQMQALSFTTPRKASEAMSHDDMQKLTDMFEQAQNAGNGFGKAK